jgi:hypothetical protein
MNKNYVNNMALFQALLDLNLSSFLSYIDCLQKLSYILLHPGDFEQLKIHNSSHQTPVFSLAIGPNSLTGKLKLSEMAQLNLHPLSTLKVSRHQIPAHNLIPNTSIQNKPLLIYHSCLPASSTTHFHSTTHEVLCISSGRARLCMSRLTSTFPLFHFFRSFLFEMLIETVGLEAKTTQEDSNL